MKSFSCAFNLFLYFISDSFRQVTHRDDPKEYLGALTDQIRVRHHVYGIKRTELPQIGSDSSLVGVSRLEKELRAVVIKPLPRKLHVSAFKVREAHPAPTSAAIALDKAHMQQVQQATMNLFEVCNGGVFVAGRAAMGIRGGSRRARPIPAAADAAGDAADVRVAPVVEMVVSEVAHGQPPRRIASTDAKLVGKFLVNDDMQWRVVNVEWLAKAKSVVAWYYSVQEAAHAGHDFSTMKARFEADLLESPLIIHADINDIRAWAKQANFSGDVS